MSIKLPGRRFRLMFSLVAVAMTAGLAWTYVGNTTEAGPKGDTGTLEKMIVANGTVSMSIDAAKLNGATRGRTGDHTFTVQPNSFFTAVVYNNELRALLPSAMDLNSAGDRAPIAALQNAWSTLAVESLPFGEGNELAINDASNGNRFFYIEGGLLDFDGATDHLTIRGGRLVLTPEFATTLGRTSQEKLVVGTVNIDLNMTPIEITQIDNGEATSSSLPPTGNDAGTVPGPDVVVGDVNGLAQFGTEAGGYVGLSLGTDSCNYGTVNLNWFALPNNDHPVIPQNMYRMSGGTDNAERFEQIGQSQMKHGFTALTQNLCGLGCNGVGGSQLGSGCSDPYSASLNSGPNLGSRAWVNPFTGFFPRGDSATPPNNHSGHNHSSGPGHRILTKVADLSTTQNVGATYYAEGQYVTPHEYSWCQSNPTQCNMNNNVSYRRYNVTGTASPFSFSPVGATVREKEAVRAWTGATFETIQPAPGVDGIGTVAYKVSQPTPGVYHYEYAIYNQNMDRGIRMFTVPKMPGVTVTDIGFYSPPQHPGSTFDGTASNLGYKEDPWTVNSTSDSVSWSTSTFAADPNANAIRWGTMYNFRFRSTNPPFLTLAVIGFYKTGDPITVRVAVPFGGSPACNRVPDGARCF